jgi:hypothetical protein
MNERKNQSTQTIEPVKEGKKKRNKYLKNKIVIFLKIKNTKLEEK